MTTLTIEDLETMTLGHGSHATREEGVNAMEAVAWLAGEKHSDAPECASTVIAAFLRAWNDSLPTDEDRQRLLRPLLPLVVGSRADNATELWRSYMAFDWLVRVHTPAWLLLAGLVDHAEALIALDEITGPATMEKALPAVNTARTAARDAAWDAAWVASSDASRDAAGAARDAAGDAAWGAAYDARAAAYDARAAAWAARDAAWGAARTAVRDAAGDAAREAARDAARSGAWAAAGDAAREAARDAARSAAWTGAGDALLPTVAELQVSAQDLVRRMVAK